MAPVLEPHNTVCPRFCLKPMLNRAGLVVVGRMGLVDFL